VPALCVLVAVAFGAAAVAAPSAERVVVSAVCDASSLCAGAFASGAGFSVHELRDATTRTLDAIVQANAAETPLLRAKNVEIVGRVMFQ